MGTNLTDAWDYIVATIEAAGVTVITDPRNARPPCVMVEPPTITANQNTKLVELSFPIIVTAPAPGNKDATGFLLTTVDDIVGALPGVTTGGPDTVQIGNQDLPAYTLTTILQIRREP